MAMGTLVYQVLDFERGGAEPILWKKGYTQSIDGQHPNPTNRSTYLMSRGRCFSI